MRRVRSNVVRPSGDGKTATSAAELSSEQGAKGTGRLRRVFASVGALGAVLTLTLTALVATAFVPGASAQVAEVATRGLEGYGYELVSPTSTAGQIADVVEIDPSGSQVLYRSGGGFADVGNLMNLGAIYRARRTDTGWETESLGGPPATQVRTYNGIDWMTDWWRHEWPVTMWPASASPGDLAGGDLRAMVGQKGGEWKALSPLADLFVVATDSQFRRVLLSGGGRPALTDGSTDGRTGARNSLYVSQLLPDGTFDIRQVAREGNAAQFPTCSPKLGGSAGGVTRGAVRRDGLTRIIYTTAACNQPARQRVWVSEPYGPTPQPYDISAAQCVDCGAQQRVEFVGASRDTERVFMTTTQRLLAADPDGSSDLYEYDFRRSTNRLQLITPSVAGANVLGTVSVSDSGSHVYFVARGELAGVELPDGRPGPVPGAPNMYLRVTDEYGQSGETRFVATLDEADSGLWGSGGRASVVRDGRILVFESRGRLTPDKLVGDAHADGYRYDAESGELRRLWVSDPQHNGALRTHGVQVAGDVRSGDASNQARGFAPSRVISESGDRVLFISDAPLVDGDDNGTFDLFLWNADDGSLAMVTDGKDPQGPTSGGLAPDGRSVFISTSSPLAPQHTATSVALFVYRPGGGYPVVDDGTGAGCVGDSCQGRSTAPPVLSTIGSIAFGGDGNVPLVPDRMRASVGVTKLKPVTGAAAKLKVRVPDAGRISVAGPSIARKSVSASKAGSYSLKIALSSNAKKSLKKKKALKITARVSYRAKDGQSAAKTVSVTFKQPKSKRAKAKKGGR